MTIEEVRALIEDTLTNWKNDCEMDQALLDYEATVKTGRLHGKYENKFYRAKLALHVAESEFDKLKKEKYEFFIYGASKEKLSMGWVMPPKPVLKGDVNMFIDAENDVMALSLMVAELKNLTQLLKDIIGMIIGRSFDIRNAIEFKKLQNGIR